MGFFFQNAGKRLDLGYSVFEVLLEVDTGAGDGSAGMEGPRCGPRCHKLGC